MNEVKEKLCNPPLLKQFDLEKQTILQTDASRLEGMGFALLQKHEDGWKLIQCGSRIISETEK